MYTFNFWKQRVSAHKLLGDFFFFLIIRVKGSFPLNNIIYTDSDAS